MKKLSLVLILSISCLALSAQTYKTYNIKYIQNKGQFVKAEATKLTIEPNQYILLDKFGSITNKVIYQGIHKEKEQSTSGQVVVFEYEKYYDIDFKRIFYISKTLNVKHNGEFYRAIIYDGQLQLAR